MSTQTQEFPGLEKLALDMFGIEFTELTPSLRRAVTHRAKMLAAEDMLDALKSLLSQTPEDRAYVARDLAKAAIAKAEGLI